MIEIKKYDALYYIEMVLRRKWWIIGPAIFTVLAGIAFTVLSPKIYKATTLILVEPQVIPDTYVKATVTESVEKRLRTIREQVYSRTNLAGIINELSIQPRPPSAMRRALDSVIGKVVHAFRAKDGSGGGGRNVDAGSMQEMVEELRQDLQVSVRGHERNQTFEISFEWHDPEVAANVANSVCKRFIKENLNAREATAAATTDFLDKETDRIRDELEAVEGTVEAFKRQHLGALPSELDSNINIIKQLREELTSLEKSLDTERQTVRGLELQIHRQRPRAQRAFPPAPAPQPGSTSPGEGAVDLEGLEAELQALSLRYTEKHPDIVALKKRIEIARLQSRGPVSSPSLPFSLEAPESDTEDIPEIRMQIQAAQNRIEQTQKQIEERRKEIEVYRDRVQRTPQVEIEMTKMLRDYQTVQQRYQSILSRKLDAKMSEELEKRHKGEQFRVLDPALKPAEPFKPDRSKILYLSIVAGLALGCSLAYLREALDPSLCGPEEIESLTGLEVIVSLPDSSMIGSPADGSRKEGSRFDFLKAGKRLSALSRHGRNLKLW